MNHSFRATKTVEVDYAHRVPRHDSKCRSVHGHRGKLEVTVEGCLIAQGSSTDMVMDFSHIKQLMVTEIVERLDHCLVVSSNDELLLQTLGISVYDKSRSFCVDLIDHNLFGPRFEVQGIGIVQLLTHGSPTAEILAYACYDVLADKLPSGCKLVCVRFWETPNSVAEYSGAVDFGAGEYKSAYINAQSA